MRVAIHDFGAYPFSAQLARALAERGHDVRYLYAAGFKTPRARLDVVGSERFSVAEVGVGQRYHSGASLRRLTQERRYGAALAAQIASFDPDAVLSANCPLDAQAVALQGTKAAGGAFIFWMQDVYSEAVRRLLSRRSRIAGALTGARYERLERNLTRRSDAIVVIDEVFRDPLEHWGVAPDRIHVVPNWAPTDDVTPGPKDNDWSRRHALANVPTFLYAGTLGRKHDPQVLVQLASATPAAEVVVVADGVGADQLKQTAGLPRNLRMLSLQPPAELGSVLASADVLVALLEPDASTFSIPSKVLTYLAAGRPVLAVMPRTNPAARIIESSRAGVVVEPGDRDRFVEAGRKLLADEAFRREAGERAAQYAQAEFGIERKVRAFEAVLNGIVLRSHSSSGAGPDTSRVTTTNQAGKN